MQIVLGGRRAPVPLLINIVWQVMSNAEQKKAKCLLTVVRRDESGKKIGQDGITVIVRDGILKLLNRKDTMKDPDLSEDWLSFHFDDAGKRAFFDYFESTYHDERPAIGILTIEPDGNKSRNVENDSDRKIA